MLHGSPAPSSKGASFCFGRILMAIVGAAVLPSINLGVNVTTVTTFSLKNVITSSYTHNTRPDADVCVEYGTSAIVTHTRLFFWHLKSFES
ncbi:MAG: DUF3172 domain-containing protein [Desmonostoc geniculatum HA4340-LM1]|jgi:hypothetical protein|nr:DUF3172 domain-containing protein [Desmonostoc geniculatum HA4340-LM1]